MKCRNKYCALHDVESETSCENDYDVESCESRKLYESDRQCDIQTGKKMRELVEEHAKALAEIDKLKEKLGKIEGAMRHE